MCFQTNEAKAPLSSRLWIAVLALVKKASGLHHILAAKSHRGVPIARRFKCTVSTWACWRLISEPRWMSPWDKWIKSQVKEQEDQPRLTSIFSLAKNHSQQVHLKPSWMLSAVFRVPSDNLYIIKGKREMLLRPKKKYKLVGRGKFGLNNLFYYSFLWAAGYMCKSTVFSPAKTGSTLLTPSPTQEFYVLPGRRVCHRPCFMCDRDKTQYKHHKAPWKTRACSCDAEHTGMFI